MQHLSYKIQKALVISLSPLLFNSLNGETEVAPTTKTEENYKSKSDLFVFFGFCLWQNTSVPASSCYIFSGLETPINVKALCNVILAASINATCALDFSKSSVNTFSAL